MAKFLTTSGTSHHLEQLIINAKTEIVLVTPYLQLSPNFIDRLRDADRRDIQISLIYGKDNLKKQEWHLLNELQGLNIYFCENLHAKCYHNDDSLIISSMNFYQFSQENNREMSILIGKDTDKKAFQNACKEIQSIVNASVIKKTSDKKEERESQQKKGISLDPNYTEIQNFHIPQLHKQLEQAYPEVSFSIEKDSLNATDQIKAKNFPIEGIDLQIDDRIYFLLSEKNDSANWYDSSAQFYENIPEAKIFLDWYKLKFYWQKRNDTVVSEQNIPIKANAYFDIVSKVANILN